ncbi:MAG: hypothetical protein DRO95_05645, partial [Candidatus Altiarchaeales archaeon]
GIAGRELEEAERRIRRAKIDELGMVYEEILDKFKRSREKLQRGVRKPMAKKLARSGTEKLKRVEIKKKEEKLYGELVEDEKIIKPEEYQTLRKVLGWHNLVEVYEKEPGTFLNSMRAISNLGVENFTRVVDILGPRNAKKVFKEDTVVFYESLNAISNLGVENFTRVVDILGPRNAKKVFKRDTISFYESLNAISRLGVENLSWIRDELNLGDKMGKVFVKDAWSFSESLNAISRLGVENFHTVSEKLGDENLKNIFIKDTKNFTATVDVIANVGAESFLSLEERLSIKLSEIAKKYPDMLPYLPWIERCHRVNPKIIDAIPILHKYGIHEFSSMLRILDQIPLSRDTIERYLKYMKKTKLSKKTKTEIITFQSAVYILYQLTRNGILGPRRAGELFDSMLRYKVSEFPEFIEKEVVPTIVENLKRQGIEWKWDRLTNKGNKESIKRWGEIDIEAKDWKDALIFSILGPSPAAKYYINKNREFEKVKWIMNKMDVNLDNPVDFLLGLCYASNLRRFREEWIEGFLKRYSHKRHDFREFPWALAEREDDAITGCLLCLPSEISHAVCTGINREIHDNHEIEDRFGLLSIESLEYIPWIVTEFVSDSYNLGVRLLRSKDERIKRKAIDVLKPRLGSRARLLDKGRIEELTPSEIYCLGRYLYKDNEVYEIVDKEDREIIDRLRRIRKYISKSYIGEITGPLPLERAYIQSLEEISIVPYDLLMEKHEIAERLSQDFRIQIIRCMKEKGISNNLLPLVTAKAFEYVVENWKRARDSNPELGFNGVIIKTIDEITPERVEGWVKELEEKGIVKRRKIKEKKLSIDILDKALKGEATPEEYAEFYEMLQDIDLKNVKKEFRNSYRILREMGIVSSSDEFNELCESVSKGVREILEDAKEGNLKLLLERLNIKSWEEFEEICKIEKARSLFTHTKEENLKWALEFYKVRDIRDLQNIYSNDHVVSVLDYAKENNLKLLLEHLNIKTVEEFEEICKIKQAREILRFAKEENLKLALDLYKVKDIRDFKDMCRSWDVVLVLSYAKENNLKLIIEHLNIKTVEEFEEICKIEHAKEVLAAKEENLKLALDLYKVKDIRDFKDMCRSWDVVLVLKNAEEGNLKLLVERLNIKTPEEFERFCEKKRMRDILVVFERDELERILEKIERGNLTEEEIRKLRKKVTPILEVTPEFREIYGNLLMTIKKKLKGGKTLSRDLERENLLSFLTSSVFYPYFYLKKGNTSVLDRIKKRLEERLREYEKLYKEVEEAMDRKDKETLRGISEEIGVAEKDLKDVIGTERKRMRKLLNMMMYSKPEDLKYLGATYFVLGKRAIKSLLRGENQNYLSIAKELGITFDYYGLIGYNLVELKKNIDERAGKLIEGYEENKDRYLPHLISILDYSIKYDEEVKDLLGIDDLWEFKFSHLRDLREVVDQIKDLRLEIKKAVIGEDIETYFTNLEEHTRVEDLKGARERIKSLKEDERELAERLLGNMNNTIRFLLERKELPPERRDINSILSHPHIFKELGLSLTYDSLKQLVEALEKLGREERVIKSATVEILKKPEEHLSAANHPQSCMRPEGTISHGAITITQAPILIIGIKDSQGRIVGRSLLIPVKTKDGWKFELKDVYGSGREYIEEFARRIEERIGEGRVSKTPIEGKLPKSKKLGSTRKLNFYRDGVGEVELESVTEETEPRKKKVTLRREFIEDVGRVLPHLSKKITEDDIEDLASI